MKTTRLISVLTALAACTLLLVSPGQAQQSSSKKNAAKSAAAVTSEQPALPQTIPIVRTGPIPFAWDASPSEGVTEYRFFADGSQLATVSANATIFTIEAGLTVGEHTVEVRAWNGFEESEPGQCVLTFRVVSRPLMTQTLRITNIGAGKPGR
jgi:hypothetical protein